MSALASTARPAPLADLRDRPNLRVVAPRRHTGRYVVLLVVVALLGITGVVSLSALAAEAAFEARALQAETRELVVRYDELTAEVAALEAPARVRAVAEDELGMVPVTEPAFLLAEARTERTEDESRAALENGEVADRIKPVLGP